MTQYKNNSRKAALVVAISVFASLALFSFLYDDIAFGTRLWLVNIFTALTFSTVAYFILFISGSLTENVRILIALIILVIFLFVSPASLKPPAETIPETADDQLPDSIERKTDSAYRQIEDNYDSRNN